ncbi:microsomal signal peptidase 12 kDa subunit-domain-containing protein [Russula dissimulans]|nr:microsomal signal peptidase 12 kDa subunit-domain-containing protein [Russula dissimulans]
MIERLSRGDDATRMSGAINEAQATNEQPRLSVCYEGAPYLVALRINNCWAASVGNYGPVFPGFSCQAKARPKPEVIMPSLAQYFEGKIDFEGQKLVERIAHYALIELAVRIFAFFVGFLFQSIQVTFVLFGFGGVAVLALIIPPWPVFNQNPVVWLPRKETKEKQQ